MIHLKRALLTLFIALSCIFVVPMVFPDISDSYTVQAAVNLNTYGKNLTKGSTYTLKMKGTSKKPKWSTSNKKVATVDSNGKVTAVSKGTAFITAKIGKKKYVCKITVKNPSPKISKSSIKIVKDSTYTLNMKNTSKKVTWYSNNKKIATVNSKGKVTAVGKGTTYIKAKVNGKTYSCKVIVEAPSFSKKSSSVNVTSKLKNPLKGSSKSISYKSNNTSIAKVDKNGTVYTIKPGTVKITATTYNKNYTYTLNIKADSSVSGWKTICSNKYYYQKGYPVTGLQTINNRKYFFNNNGILTSKFGIDVSTHQGVIDWNKVKADGVQFAILRCGYGMDQEDQDDAQFKKNISECKRLGIPFGVYLYSYANTLEKASSEADHVLRLVNSYKPDLGIWYDVEDKIQSNLEPELLTNIINTFCKKIKNKGYSVGIYSNTHWLTNKINSSITNQYPVWVAQYYETCEYAGKYVLWQYTSNGAVNGITSKVDYNIMF